MANKNSKTCSRKVKYLSISEADEETILSHKTSRDFSNLVFFGRLLDFGFSQGGFGLTCSQVETPCSCGGGVDSLSISSTCLSLSITPSKKQKTQSLIQA